jgi:hypothetical protein
MRKNFALFAVLLLLAGARPARSEPETPLREIVEKQLRSTEPNYGKIVPYDWARNDEFIAFRLNMARRNFRKEEFRKSLPRNMRDPLQTTLNDTTLWEVRNLKRFLGSKPATDKAIMTAIGDLVHERLDAAIVAQRIMEAKACETSVMARLKRWMGW